MPKSFVKERVPSIRVVRANEVALNPEGGFVLYWMIAARRTTWNHALERAVELAEGLRKPLLIVETLGSGDRWASDRHHAFVLQGMADNKAACKERQVTYYPFVDLEHGDAAELIVALANRSCAVVADDFPIKSFNAEASRVAARIDVRMERVDSNGLLPMRAADRAFPTAYAFRRFLQRTLPDHLPDAPMANPLARLDLPRLRGLPSEIRRRWPPASSSLLAANTTALARLPIDHEVGQVRTRGGPVAARKKLKTFIKQKLATYPDSRNHPDDDGTSGLSPYLHFGHVSVHEVFRELARSERWSPAKLGEKATGGREGWWGMSKAAEAFLDELVTCAKLASICAASRRITTYLTPCPTGPRQRFPNMRRIDARMSTHRENSNRAAPTIDCGTPPKCNSSPKVACITTCGCCGGKRYSSGRPLRATP